MTDAANTDVTVVSILASSVVVLSDTAFPVRNDSANSLSRARAFLALLEEDAQGVFTDPFFSTFGQIWSESTTLESSEATDDPSIELLLPLSPPTLLTSQEANSVEGTADCSTCVNAAYPCLSENDTSCDVLTQAANYLPPPPAGPCSAAGDCSIDPPVECVVDKNGARSCAACPSGYEGDGVTCLDVDECADGGSRGVAVLLCDPMAGCVNTVGSYHCGSCPDGWRGAGDEKCMQVGLCSNDHGGCDPLLECVDVEGGLSKCEGGCPPGFVENNAEDPSTELSHCVDVDGCVEAPCHPGVACVDLLAPSLGRECGPCPIAFIGDGAVCKENPCFQSNGGCDPSTTCTAEPSAPRGRVCGACLEGLAATVDADGADVCVNEDWCVLLPCFPGVECRDHFPETGRTCETCPPGYIGDGVVCEDVDECKEANGGCWSSADGILLSRCINSVGSYECGPCVVEADTGSLVMGWMGSGRTGCIIATGLCADNNGGCWVGESVYAGSSTTCSQEPGTSAVSCGPCPTGFEGLSGASGCIDEDGCALDPCFPGVQCTDTLAPGTGRYCGLCPEGYKGDGVECEKCTIETTIKGSTAMSGVMRRAYTNEVIAALHPGLSDPNCTNMQGVGYQWRGGSSGGELVELVSLLRLSNKWRVIGQAMTLRLPKDTLLTGQSYTIQMTAFLLGNMQVKSQNRIEFFVEPMPLRAQLVGGDTRVSEGALVVLNASSSYDPNTDNATLRFAWTCRRSTASPEPCRLADGTVFPQRLATAALKLRLQGGVAPAGVALTFGVTVSSGVLSDSATTTVVVVATETLPEADAAVYSLAEPPAAKLPANQDVSLVGTVVSSAPETLRLEWSAQRQVAGMGDADGSSEAAAGDPLDLTVCALTPLTGANLVVMAGMLQAGATYIFRLDVEDVHGASYKTLTVRMNEAPSHGQLKVAPHEGRALNTSFTVEALEWYDEDFPLWYEIKYQVVGAEKSMPRALGAMQGFAGPYAYLLPEGGLEKMDHLVNISLLVRDSLGALTEAAEGVRVTPAVYASLTTRNAQADAMLASGMSQLRNGEADESVLALDMAAAVLKGAPVEASATTSEEAALARREQRTQQVNIAAGAANILPADSTSVERLLSSVSTFVDSPAEVSSAARSTALTLVDALVASTLTGSSEIILWSSSAATVCQTLSDLADSDFLEGAALPSNTSAGHSPGADTAAAVDALDLVGRSVLQGMVAGQEPAKLSAASLALSVQRLDLAGDAAVAWRGEVPALRGAAGPARVSFPASMGVAAQASAGAVDTVLLSSAHNPHREERQNSSAGGQTRSLLAERSEGSASAMTAITLQAAANGAELSVRELREAFNFTLPLTGASSTWTELVLKCSFWDEASGAYNDTGCATLPIMAPPDAALYWATRNTSDLHGSLQDAWEVGNVSYYMAGCQRELGAWFPQYEGRDAGYRKYVPMKGGSAEAADGGGCVLAEVGNTVGCWWRWQAQAFEGPGCVRATEVSCLCTHLTDFMAMASFPLGEPSQSRVEMLSLSQMASVEVDDLADSMVLLLLVGSILGTGVVAFVSSNISHNKERLELLSGLFAEDSGGLSFHEVCGLWTWSIMEESGTFAGQAIDFVSRAEVDSIAENIEQLSMGTNILRTSKRIRDTRHKRKVSKQAPNASEKQNHGLSEAIRGAFGAKAFTAARLATRANAKRQEARLRKADQSSESLPEFTSKEGVARISTERLTLLEETGFQVPRSETPSTTLLPQSNATVQAASGDIPGKEDCRGTPGPAVDILGSARKSTIHISIDQKHETCRLLAPPPKPHRRKSQLSLAGPQALGQRFLEDASQDRLPVPRPSVAGTFLQLPLLDKGLAAHLTRHLTHQRTLNWEVHRGPGPVVEASAKVRQLRPGSNAGQLNDGLLCVVPSDSVQHMDLDDSPRKLDFGEPETEQPSWFGRMLTATPGMVSARCRVLTGLRSTNLACRDSIQRVKTFFTDNTQAAKTELLNQRKSGTGHLKAVTLCKALGINVLRLQACIPISDMATACLNTESMMKSTPRAADKRVARTAFKSLHKLQFDGWVEELASGEAVDAVAESLCALGQSMTREALLSLAEATESVRTGEDASRKELVGALSFERMLGTALVHSYLHANRLVRYEEMTKQAALAEMVPWEKAVGRSFTWYVTVMIEVTLYVNNDGWYKRATLFNLVLLQSFEGSYRMTQTLANLLYAGKPEQVLSEDAVIPTFSLESLMESVPPRIYLLCEKDCQLAQDIWATLCAIACYDLIPFEWVHNPLEDPTETQTLGERSLSWVERICADNSLDVLLTELPKLKAEAGELVVRWEEQHIARIDAFYARAHEPAPRSPAAVSRVRSLPARLGSGTASLLKLAYRTHPLVQIFLTLSTDSFTRSERVLLQTTMIFMMLLFSMAFYHSRAFGCCLLLQEHLGCPLDMATGADTAACVGAASCMALYVSWKSDLLPVELWQDKSSYTCNAFPAPTWIGRLECVMVIVACLLPVNVLLSSLFGMSNASKMAMHLRPAPHKQRYKMKVTLSWLVPVMQTIGYALYGMLINVQMLNRAMAMLLVLTISVMWNRASHIKEMINSINDVILKRRKESFKSMSLKRAKSTPGTDGILDLNSIRSGSLELWTTWLAFFLVGAMWATGTWALLTYGMLIRRMMGAEEETQMLAAFGYALLMEQLGLQGAKLVVLRVFVVKAVNLFSTLLNRHAPIQQWYENKVNDHLAKVFAKDDIVADDDDLGEIFNESLDMDMW
ncbi:hypothetical protein CYMTET_14563 [Cymbomonas tetramitiformis]|uniref:EGF-like domain-containing protein n=1 Tax=Cymbomonas tetramitiformis TaxID=36881 RepID=A0AAE0LA87_9CHLO|nr:hypothetical protein CYMTET_14563 [Cymbomonas tetramitiformis]